MDHQQNCQGCAQKNSCEDVYQRMGHSKAPPVTRKILVAFVLPMLVFVVCLAGVQHWMGHEHPKLTMLAGFSISIAVTLLFVWLTKQWARK